MLIIVLLIAAFNLTSSAPVLPSTSDFEAAAPVTIFGRELSESISIADYRTVQDIVLSCLATIFTCTWVAIHQNVPSPTDSRWKRIWTTVLTTLVGFLAPEVIIGAAMGEWWQAVYTATAYNSIYRGVKNTPNYLWWYFNQPDKYDQRKGHWTMTHGFFFGMGGLVDDSGSPVANLQDLVPCDIPKNEINDKSKSDFLTKSFVVLQTTWFITQCFSRWIARLPVTELEVTTLAYAVLNLVTYAIWWDKPQSVGLALQMSRYKKLEGVPQEQRETAGAEPRPKDRRWGHNLNRWRHRLIIFMFRYLSMGVAVVVLGPVFGVLHLVSLWSSPFPSPVDKLMWKVCAIAVTTLPIPTICSMILPKKWGRIWYIPCFLYAVARIILVVLAFTTLRELPPDALRVIAWTTYIPHL